MLDTPATEAISINIRAKVRQRDLIDQAAVRCGRSRSDFMFDAATFKKCQKLLDKPLPSTDRLRQLLKTKAPWDKASGDKKKKQ
jgi:uncharacterized protein (DUF1778 family)